MTTWTTPRTWVTDEVPTSAIMNTHIRDNENALREGQVGLRGQVAANGSILAGSGFTVTYNSTGNYTLNWTVAFPTAPIVVVTHAGTEAVWGGPIISGISLGATAVLLRDVSNVQQDGIFNFIAVAS